MSKTLELMRRRAMMGKVGILTVDVFHPDATYIKTKASTPDNTTIVIGNYFQSISKIIMDGVVIEDIASVFNGKTVVNGGAHEYYIYRSPGWVTTNGYVSFRNHFGAEYIDTFRCNRGCTNSIQGNIYCIGKLMLLDDNAKPVSPTVPTKLFVPQGSTAYSSLGFNIIEVNYNIIED